MVLIRRALVCLALVVAGVTEAAGQRVYTPYSFSTLAGSAEDTCGFAEGPQPQSRLCSPFGIAVDSRGNVYLAGGSVKISPSGTVTLRTLSDNPAGHDVGLAVDAQDNLYVADQENARILRVTPDGSVTTLAGSKQQFGDADGVGAAARFTWPVGIAVDGWGVVYVTDLSRHVIRSITPDGVVRTIAGLPGVAGSSDGVASARFSSPVGIAAVPFGTCGSAFTADPCRGVVYVADNQNHTIRRLQGTSEGPILGPATVTTLAGKAGEFGSADGGPEARFFYPNGLALISGSLYVADEGNLTIRNVVPGSGQVTTFAGAASVSGIADGPVTAARFKAPAMIAAGPDGSLYVTDEIDNTVRRISPLGMVSTLAGKAGSSRGADDGPAADARFYRTRGIAVDASGTVYVTQPETNTIRRLKDGVVTTFAGRPYYRGSTSGTGTEARFVNPAHLTVSPAGIVYVADGTIRAITPDGTVSDFAGGSRPRAGFTGASSVAAGRDGTLYFIGDYTIGAISPEGVVRTLAGSPGELGYLDGKGSAARFGFTIGIAVDAAGTVYVTEYSMGTIRKIAPDGTVSTFAGAAIEASIECTSRDGTGSAARFCFPYGIVVDGAGTVFVTEWEGGLVRKITPAGAVTTVGGDWDGAGQNCPQPLDGIGKDARFCLPAGLAVDAAGRLFIAEFGTNIIRMGVPPYPLVFSHPANRAARAGTNAEFTAAASGVPAPSLRWQMSSDAGATWSNLADSSTYTGTSSAKLVVRSVSADLNGLRYRVVAVNTEASATSQAATLTVLPPHLVTPGGLQFGATKAGAAGALTAVTGSQSVTVTFAAPVSPWTAVADKSWLQLGSASGSDTGTFTATLVNPGNVIGGASVLTATITVTASGAPTLPVRMPVTLSVDQTGVGAAPFGAIDTPVDGASGVTGSIAVTGWALDDVGVTRVRIFRASVAPEPANTTIYLGDAVLVDGARPDLSAQFPAAPRNTRGGWGHLLLTNFLPGLGNGIYTLYAYADDADGHSTLLGTRTIVCTNGAATTPFGAIDTPGQGETVAGTVTNFGWVLSPGLRRADPPGGGTVTVFIDGAPVGDPGGWVARPDLSALFPAAQYSGVSRALGVFQFDSRSLNNGVHTIAWVVTDNSGGSAGVGSRYFTVLNATGQTIAPDVMIAAEQAPATGTVLARLGFDPAAEWTPVSPDANGLVVVEARELDRIELTLGDVDSGYQRSPAGPLPLPAGSRLDPATGRFVWQPGPGFVGAYDVVFRTPNRLLTVRVILAAR